MPEFKKYGWLNNPPDGLVANLRAQVAAVRQPKDEEAFRRLRDKQPRSTGSSSSEKSGGTASLKPRS